MAIQYLCDVCENEIPYEAMGSPQDDRAWPYTLRIEHKSAGMMKKDLCFDCAQAIQEFVTRRTKNDKLKAHHKAHDRPMRKNNA